ncbi:alkaline phosphatase [Anabaena cylindrica FACHB-243]|uniref:Alkaline phosphatase n=1 Tax=Anabaena cylindrica (strain ATCC 27899 / PCC 7122) TaxID=272123 RepID=K9ZNF2_ANACC|nr:MULTISPECIES: alkaline phosphatase [Anabaena]AFZ60319.1 Alkaline phosphatase [Anabaena cylindrica PCC 7122]MBD2418954.1 alkaline phosphatase [Anabaena cylindrica FACHB-243]MBY5282024.1 alkaline phosphatase [Anabaena sp. CCAP 1446/1C]MBY5308862.1 alkaline phosphatase [Anabaena sp. CCAP 1446/1C]MCM2404545.1 alkaline phosphatase [Anabaena sp. CCAP 1446/1C]
MAKNTIIMIGDGMGWEMARAAAIAKEIEAGATGTTLADFYTEGKGTGLSFQNLSGYGLVTTYGTTIAGNNGTFNVSNTARNDANQTINTPTGTAPVREGFEFDPTFNPGTTPNGGAKVSEGAVGNLVGYDPVQGGINPWTPGNNPEYIKYSYPDSANTATTLYTGVKSYNGAIGVDIFENPVESILTQATQQGKSTGLVSSVPIDHATPGAAAANVNNRNKFDEFGVIDTILQQELGIYKPTVLLGGGHPLSNVNNPLPAEVEPPSDHLYISEETYAELKNNPTDNIYGYTFLERGPDAAEVLAETASQLDPEKGDRLLGVYGARGQDGNLPVSSANGDYSTTGLGMFTVFASQGQNPDTVRPLLPGETDESFIAREINENPTLDDLTKAALTVLEKDKDGFWLMVEAGDVDWSAHDDNIDNMIGTMLDFDKSVQSVMNWIEANGGWEENLLVVTADHDHYLTLNQDFPELLRNQGGEALTDIDTVEGSGHYWGSSETTKYGWGTHTNRPVPVYYQGAGSEVLDGLVSQGYEAYGYDIPGIDGLGDQTHIYQTMFAAVTEEAEKELVFGTSDSDTLIATVDIDGVQDTIFTGAGNDEIDFAFNSDARRNRVNSGSGDDLIYVSRRDRAFGTEGNDEFDATDSQGENRMSGGAGSDIFYLGADDRALGGDGDDKFYVQDGGNNLLSGGDGADQFWILTGDLPGTANTVLDFETGTDVLGIGGQGAGFDFTDLTLSGNNIAVGNTIIAILIGINTTSLTAADFAFV